MFVAVYTTTTVQHNIITLTATRKHALLLVLRWLLALWASNSLHSRQFSKRGKRFGCLHLCTAVCVAMYVVVRVSLSLVYFAAFGSSQSFLLLPLLKVWEEPWVWSFRLIRFAIRLVRLVQCEVVWSSVKQCDAVWCSVMQCDAVWCSVMQRVATQLVKPANILQNRIFSKVSAIVALCCKLSSELTVENVYLQPLLDTFHLSSFVREYLHLKHCLLVSMCCSLLQCAVLCVALCIVMNCSVFQCVV